MQQLSQIIFAALGAIAFSVLFNAKGKKILASAVGAAITVVVYNAALKVTDDKVISLFFATLAAAVFAEIMARIIKAPVIVFLVPILVPLFPGGDLYYTTINFVQGNTAQFGYYAKLVLSDAGVIGFGVIMITSTVQVVLKVFRHFKKSAL